MADTVASKAPAAAQRAHASLLRQTLSRLFREKKLGAVGLIIVVLFLLVGIFADVLATHGMFEQNVPRRIWRGSRPAGATASWSAVSRATSA